MKRDSEEGQRLTVLCADLVSPAVCLTDLNNEPGLWFVYQVSTPAHEQADAEGVY